MPAGRVVAAAVLLNRLGSGTVALTFLSLKAAIGIDNVFYMYAGLALATALFYARFVVESKGKALEER